MNTHVLSQFIYYTNEKFDNANLYTLVPEKMDSPRVPKCHFKRIEGIGRSISSNVRQVNGYPPLLSSQAAMLK